MLKQDAYETSIVPLDDLRMKHLKQRGNYMNHENVEQENLDFSVILLIVQFYAIKYNSQSDCWIELKFYQDFPEIFLYIEL